MDDNERDDQATEEEPSQAPRRRVWWPGAAALFERWRNRLPPHYDPQKSREVFRPVNRLVRWDGYTEDHTAQACAFPRCRADEQGYGRHEEARPEGFVWEDVYFQSLEEALGNQAFLAWYSTEEGQAVIARWRADPMSALVPRPPQYELHEAPPLPRYNFLIHEHLHEMRAQEVHDYYAKGEVPTRFRRRGRTKAKPPILSISDEEA